MYVNAHCLRVVCPRILHSMCMSAFIKNTDFSKIKIGKVEEISKSGNSIKIWFPSNGKSSGKNKSYNIKDVHPLVHGP